MYVQQHIYGILDYNGRQRSSRPRHHVSMSFDFRAHQHSFLGYWINRSDRHSSSSRETKEHV